MANSRIITSAIWEDEWFGPLSFFEQALWIGLFSRCADDQGRLLDNPVVIRAAVFPYKDASVDEIDAAVAGFAEAGRVHRYQSDGKALVQITNWWEHQRQQWASASKWLPPEGWQDHVRTRQNNDMLTVNWLGKDQNYTQHVGWLPVQVNAQVDVQVNDQVGGHIPIPIPIPIPVPTLQQQQPARDYEPPADPNTATLFQAIRAAGVTIAGTMQAEAWRELLTLTEDASLLREAVEETVRQGKQPSPAYVSSIVRRCVLEKCRPGERTKHTSDSGNGARASPSPTQAPPRAPKAGKNWVEEKHEVPEHVKKRRGPRLPDSRKLTE